MIIVSLACSKEPAITKEMVDGGTLFDPSIYKPENYLVSKAMPTPTPAAMPQSVCLLPPAIQCLPKTPNTPKTCPRNASDGCSYKSPAPQSSAGLFVSAPSFDCISVSASVPVINSARAPPAPNLPQLPQLPQLPPLH